CPLPVNLCASLVSRRGRPTRRPAICNPNRPPKPQPAIVGDGPTNHLRRPAVGHPNRPPKYQPAIVADGPRAVPPSATQIASRCRSLTPNLTTSTNVSPRTCPS